MMLKEMQVAAHLYMIMHNICIWNVRGLHIPRQQKEVMRVLQLNRWLFVAWWKLK